MIDIPILIEVKATSRFYFSCEYLGRRIFALFDLFNGRSFICACTFGLSISLSVDLLVAGLIQKSGVKIVIESENKISKPSLNTAAVGLIN